MEVTTRNLAEGDKESADVKLFRIRLMGHCIFCLRKTSRSKEALRTLPRNCATIEELEEVPNSDLDMLTFSGHLVTTFNRIWPYLQEGKRDGNEEDPLTFLEMPEEKSWKVTKSTRFSRLPKICHFCAENLEAVDRLWRELAGHVKRLRVTVKESKCGGKYKWRGERFEETLRNSDMEVESVRAILEFLEMGDRSSGEDRKVDKSDIENVDHGMKCSTPEILITSSSIANEKDNANCPSTSSTQKSTTISDGDTNSRRLSRQDSVEIISRNPTPVEKQQSSDIYTSHENELSIDREEAEEADDERDSEYTMLEQEEDEEEVITISDDDTEEPITTVANMAYKNTGSQMSAFGYATLVTSYTENPTNKNLNLNKNKNRIPLLDNAAMERDNLANNNPTATTSSATTSTSVHTQLNEEIANQVLANVVQIPTDMVQCSQCHMLFPTWEKLVDHMSKHRNSGLPCDICKDGVKYFIHNLLREHYCTVHGIGEQFPCPLCPAVYFTPQTLKTHIKTRHKNETLQYPQLRN